MRRWLLPEAIEVAYAKRDEGMPMVETAETVRALISDSEITLLPRLYACPSCGALHERHEYVEAKGEAGGDSAIHNMDAALDRLRETLQEGE